MSIDPEVVARAAHLARLSVTNEELDTLTRDLGRILDQIDVLGSLQGSAPAGVEADPLDPPSTRALGDPGPNQLAGAPGTFAPDFREGFFVVPPLPGVRPGGGED